MSREFTTRMLELLDEGMFDKDILLQDLLGYLSEDEVKDFVRRNDFFGFEDLGFISSNSEDYDDSMDGDHASALASAGWGTEEDYYGDNALEQDFA